MNDDKELEEIRKRRALQLQQSEAQQAVAEEQRNQVEAQKQAILRSIMTQDAKERLGTLKITKPDLVASIEEQLIMLYQSGRLQEQIDDATLKQLLLRMTPEKKEIKITRR